MAAIEAGVITSEIKIDASRETVFEFFTDAEKMGRWKGRAELEARPGGIYRVEIDPENTARGEFVEVSPYDRVVFTWGWEGDEVGVPPGSSTVEVNLVDDGDGTVVQLMHRGLPEAALALHESGWERFLPRLASAAAANGR